MPRKTQTEPAPLLPQAAKAEGRPARWRRWVPAALLVVGLLLAGAILYEIKRSSEQLSASATSEAQNRALKDLHLRSELETDRLEYALKTLRGCTSALDQQLDTLMSRLPALKARLAELRSNSQLRKEQLEALRLEVARLREINSQLATYLETLQTHRSLSDTQRSSLASILSKLVRNLPGETVPTGGAVAAGTTASEASGLAPLNVTNIQLKLLRKKGNQARPVDKIRKANRLMVEMALKTANSRQPKPRKLTVRLEVPRQPAIEWQREVNPTPEAQKISFEADVRERLRTGTYTIKVLESGSLVAMETLSF